MSVVINTNEISSMVPSHEDTYMSANTACDSHVDRSASAEYYA